MFIEQPPYIIRQLFKATWRKKSNRSKDVYLTFDDGPNQNVTLPLLDILDKYSIKATFFCVGDNVKKNPDLYAEILRHGHSVGNHTMHHLKGFNCTVQEYLADIQEASLYIDSKLIRPPYGRIKRSQMKELRKQYEIVMWDLITRDYNSHLSPDDIYKIVRRYTRNGSIIVFHDSLKASKNMLGAIEPCIQWLQQQGYTFKTL